MDEILFVGTGAADWVLHESQDFVRRNASVLVNEDLLVDCGPHIRHFAGTFHAQVFDKVTDVLITHDHKDHFCLETFLTLAQRQKIRLACDGYIRELVGEHPNVQFVSVRPYRAFRLGKYHVMPVLANHDVVQKGERQACHYIIRTPRRKKIFYGLDGAWFLRPTWEEMQKHKFDLMVLDCTVGDQRDWRAFEHNSIPMLRMMTEEIRRQEMLRKNGVMIASHLAKTLHLPHEETEKILSEIGVQTAYDGLKLKI